MTGKSKLISGLKYGKDFTWEEREEIVRDYLSSNLTKQEVWKKYTGQEEEHGQLLRWMRVLGYDSSIPSRRRIFESRNFQMKRKKSTSNQELSFEEQQLKNRIAELEKQLRDAEMKAIAYSTMVDIAEKEFNISIRKKYTTKPSKK